MSLGNPSKPVQEWFSTHIHITELNANNMCNTGSSEEVFVGLPDSFLFDVGESLGARTVQTVSIGVVSSIPIAHAYES